MTTPRLGAPELVSGQATPETTVNEQIRYIESGAGHFIFLSRVVATPPGSPADGDCYLIAASPTGAWAGQAGKIAFRVNTAWAFITPIAGFTAVVNDEAHVFVGYDGAAWNTLASASGTYVPLTYLDTDGALAANSDTKIATQKAVKTFVGNAVTGLLELKGSQDCSANPNYPVASKGDSYVVSVSGKIGGASGATVSAGDVFFATADNAGGTQASVGSSWDVIVHSGGTGSAITAKDEGTTLTSGMTSINFTGAGVTATNSGTDVSVSISGGGGGSSGAKGVPGGRLTLVSATPVLTSDQTAKSTVYYTPYVGTDIPIWSGSAWGNQTFAELTLALDTSNHLLDKLYDVFVWNNAGTISIGAGPSWAYSSTVTFSSSIVSWTAHGLSQGEPVVFTTTGTLPTGITAGTVYYAVPTGTNTFTVATSRANAYAGTTVSMTGSGTGTHTGTAPTHARGTGAGTTELQMKDGIWTNKNSITLTNGAGAGTSGIAANTATYVGTIYCTANGQTGMAFKPAAAAGGTNSILGVYNAFNRVNTVSTSRDSTSSWTYATSTWRAANGSVSNRVSFVDGLQQSGIVASSRCTVGGANGAWIAGNLDSGTATPGISAQTANAGQTFAHAREDFPPQLGLHYVQAVEMAATGFTSTFFSFGSSSSFQAISAELMM